MNNKVKYDTHNIDYDKCVENIGGRFNLILVASARAREIKRGHSKKVKENNSIIVTVLREIEQGLTEKDYLRKV